MPENSLQVLQLRPGVNREGTSYSGEGGWYSCDKVRFRSGLPEKLGGWMPYGVGSYQGICRHYAEWVTLSNFYLLGVGTNSRYYILIGGEYSDITPQTSVGHISSNPVYSLWGTLSAGVSATDTLIPVTSVSGGNFNRVVPFVVTIGSESIYVPAVDAVGNTLGTTASPCVRGYAGTTAATHATSSTVSSSWLAINFASNNAVVGNTVNLSPQAIPPPAPNPAPYPYKFPQGAWEILAANTNYIGIDGGIFSTAAVQFGPNMGVYYLLDSGSPYEGVVNGWGAGPWNSSRNWNEPYTTTSPASQIRLWSAGNYGEDLFFNPRNLGIYYWAASQGILDLGASGIPNPYYRGEDIANSAFTGVDISQIVVGNYYVILSLGGVTQPQWNTIAGTTAVTYAVGDRFFCADVIAGLTGELVADPAIPSVAASVLTTDERHVVAFGCNDAITPLTPLQILDLVTAGNFVIGQKYTIYSLGTTNFTLIGAYNNAPGTSFTATGVGTGTGKASPIVQDPMYIAWCSQQQPQTWWPTQTNTAGSYRLTYGSKIVTAEKTRQEILVFTDTALYSMQYLGAPYVYGFNPISVDITIVGPNAVITTNGITFWMGQDKFYAYSGRVDTLPCALRQYVFDDINADQFAQVYAGTNEKYNEIWWFYPSSGSLINDRYVVYNYLEKIWYYGQLSRTAWLDSHIIGNPVAAVPNFTNPLEFTGITVQHETGADDGSVNPIQPIDAYIETSDFDIGDGGYQFSFVKRIIPDVDFIGSTVTDPSVTLTLKARNYPGIGLNTDAMQSTTGAISGKEISTQVYDYTNMVWVRIRGRQLAFRIGSDALGVKWQLGVPRLELQSDGRK